jgi:hypothetical protein
VPPFGQVKLHEEEEPLAHSASEESDIMIIV